MSYLITGLGNIGPEYESTRHNAGFLVLDRLATLNKLTFEVSRYGYYTKFRYKGKIAHLVKPSTYMNNSGKAVNYWLQHLKIETKDSLVVVDDISLPYGSLRLRKSGSSAGHNGLISIEQQLGSQEYPRLRVGIGNDYSKGNQVDYVLSRFNKVEISQLIEILNKAVEIIYSFVAIGTDRTMSHYNKRTGSTTE